MQAAAGLLPSRRLKAQRKHLSCYLTQRPPAERRPLMQQPCRSSSCRPQRRALGVWRRASCLVCWLLTAPLACWAAHVLLSSACCGAAQGVYRPTCCAAAAAVAFSCAAPAWQVGSAGQVQKQTCGKQQQRHMLRVEPQHVIQPHAWTSAEAIEHDHKHEQLPHCNVMLAALCPYLERVDCGILAAFVLLLSVGSCAMDVVWLAPFQA
jgi:hypothetical protein